MTGQDHDFSHLDRAGRATAGVARNPRLAINIILGAGILLAWLLLGRLAVRFDVLVLSWPPAAREPVVRHIPHAFEAVGRFQMFN